MLIINFEGLEVKGLSKGRYDETFAGEDALLVALMVLHSSLRKRAGCFTLIIVLLLSCCCSWCRGFGILL